MINLNTNRVSHGDNTFEYEKFMADLNVTQTGNRAGMRGGKGSMNSSYMQIEVSDIEIKAAPSPTTKAPRAQT